MPYTCFKFEIADGIAHITLDRPERGNPMDLAFNTELSFIATECDENQSVRCVVIDSVGKYFGGGTT